jgi:hypothetical protein
MHGLVICALARFFLETYGAAIWQQIRGRADAGDDRYEPFLKYPDDLAIRLISAAGHVLRRHPDDVWEDFGAALIASDAFTAPRRLLRFSGASFGDFLSALPELSGRITLAVPDFDLPPVTLIEQDVGTFMFRCPASAEYEHVLRGVIRAMADEYGALALIDHGPEGHGVQVQLIDVSFAAGRAFALGRVG